MPFKLSRYWSMYRGICWWILVLGECAVSTTAQIWRGGPVLQLGYSSVLFGKQWKIHPWVMRWADPKKERGSILAPHFICFFFSPWAFPMWIGLAMRVVCFTWGSHSGSRIFFCSIFARFFFLSFFPFFFFFLRFFFLCLLATTILDSFSLF